MNRPVIPALLLLTLVASACTSSPGAQPKSTAPTAPAFAVKTARVTRGDLDVAVDYTGDLRARSVVQVLPKTSGRVEKLAVDVGSRVKAGDLIAQLDRESAEIQALRAKAQLTAAEARLAQINAGPRPEQVAQAEANWRAARARLDALLRGPRPEQVAQAELNLDVARQRLAALEAGGRPEAISQAEANLDAAKAKLDQLLAGPRDVDVEAAKLQLDQAKNALFAAQAYRDVNCSLSAKVRDGGALCNQGTASAYTAEVSVTQAQNRLDQLRAPATKEALDQARAAVRAAEQQLALASRPATEWDLAQARDAVSVAEQQLALARAPYTEQDLAQARAAADAAEQAYRLAQNPVTEQDVRVAEATVEQARAEHDLAMLGLREAVVLAPVGGVVTDRFVSEGALVGMTTPIVTITPPELELVVAVEEAQLGRIAAGQPANLSVAAYPGEAFSGKVSLIAPTVDVRSRTAQVKIAPEDPAGKLKPGMFAQLRITTETRRGALLLPTDAVLGKGDATAVFVVEDGRARKVPVRLGLAGDGSREVISGLREGQEVVVSGLQQLNDGDTVTVR